MKRTRTIAAPGEHAVLLRALRRVRLGWTGKAMAVTRRGRRVGYDDLRASRFSLLGALNRAAGDGVTSSQALAFVPGDFGPALNVQPQTKAGTLRSLRVGIRNARSGTPGWRPEWPAGVHRPGIPLPQPRTTPEQWREMEESARLTPEGQSWFADMIRAHPSPRPIHPPGKSVDNVARLAV